MDKFFVKLNVIEKDGESILFEKYNAHNNNWIYIENEKNTPKQIKLGRKNGTKSERMKRENEGGSFLHQQHTNHIITIFI
jgi:hypothetical protein